MTILEWTAHGALLFLLAVMVPFAWRLERQISALRREGSALEAGAAKVHLIDGRLPPFFASCVEWKCQGASRWVPLCVVSVTHSAAAASPSG